MSAKSEFARRLLRMAAMEPPLRSLLWATFFLAPVSAQLKARWSAARLPQYLVGTLQAAEQARGQGVGEISVIEFGVATGRGLTTLEHHAALVQKETGVKITVYGFDSGTGLPSFTGDYRDHPDVWRPGDYPMDEGALRQRLRPETNLIIGDVAETVPQFIEQGHHAPIGFVSMDLDLYSSTVAALQVFSSPNRHMLHRAVIYFDDILGAPYHSWAGERLAISEFNEAQSTVKIDAWYGLSYERPFPEMAWLQQMYIAHDLDAISGYQAPPRPSIWM